LVKKESSNEVVLTNEKEKLLGFYTQLEQSAARVDESLGEHVKALHTRALEKIEALEKKMMRAERRKFDTQQRQIHKLRHELFPNENLQERVDNFSVFYSIYGRKWLNWLYDCSLTVEQEFGIVTLPSI
jgi:uncharacterized protein YllA (UPF0747 family)